MVSENRRKLKIKQIMPVPRGMSVMMACDDDQPGIDLEYADNTGWTHVLAVVEGQNGLDDSVAVYEFDGESGMGNIAPDGTVLVRDAYCRSCGRKMIPHMKWMDGRTLYYTCDGEGEHGRALYRPYAEGEKWEIEIATESQEGA